MRILTTLVVICYMFAQTPILSCEPSKYAAGESMEKPSVLDPQVIDRICREVSVGMYERNAHQASTYLETKEDKQDSQRQGWINRHPVIFGTIVGFGGGFAIGYAVGPSGTTNTDKEIAACLFGAIGAGVGALIGKVASRD